MDSFQASFGRLKVGVDLSTHVSRLIPRFQCIQAHSQVPMYPGSFPGSNVSRLILRFQCIQAHSQVPKYPGSFSGSNVSRLILRLQCVQAQCILILQMKPQTTQIGTYIPHTHTHTSKDSERYVCPTSELYQLVK